MAKNYTYTEDQLLDAVIRYADTHAGKIQATKLAKWASENIEGMEGIRYYIFMRPVSARNPKTGKLEEHKRECTKRIEEINASRDIVNTMKKNALLYSSNINVFFDLPKAEQMKLILKTREQVDTLASKNAYLARENKALVAENKALQKQAADLGKKLVDLKKKQELLSTQVAMIADQIDEERRREALRSIGISDEGIDLNQYVASLSIGIDEAFSINDAIRNNRSQMANLSTQKLTDGINF